MKKETSLYPFTQICFMIDHYEKILGESGNDLNKRMIRNQGLIYWQTERLKLLN